VTQIFKIQGRNYVRVGDMLIPCNKDGVVENVTSEQTPNASGGMDCTIHVHCLKIASKQNKLGEKRDGLRNL